MEANFSQSNRRNAFNHTFSTQNQMIKFISNFDYNACMICKLPLSPSSVFVRARRMMVKELNRTVQSTVLFIGTSKLLSIKADVTMKVTSNLLTNSNL